MSACSESVLLLLWRVYKRVKSQHFVRRSLPEFYHLFHQCTLPAGSSYVLLRPAVDHRSGFHFAAMINSGSCDVPLLRRHTRATALRSDDRTDESLRTSRASVGLLAAFHLRNKAENRLLKVVFRKNRALRNLYKDVSRKQAQR